MKFFLLCTTYFCSLFSCKNVDIDNSSLDSLLVIVDEKMEFWMLPGARVSIHLDSGKHVARVVEHGVSIRKADFVVKNGGFLNVGAQLYVIWRDLYGEQTYRPSLLREQFYDIDDVQYYADLEYMGSEKLYHEKRWDYGLTEPFPETTPMTRYEEYAIRGKLYRVQDFVHDFEVRAPIRAKKEQEYRDSQKKPYKGILDL